MKKQLEIGDVFEVPVSGGKKYMQFIGDDWHQLNSSVIRVFKKIHSKDTVYDLSLLEDDEEEFCVHVVDIRQGEKENLWHKVANEEVVGADNKVFFKGSHDLGNPEVKVSKDWYVWQFGEDGSQEVSQQDEILDHAYVELIMQPKRVYEMIENGGTYPGVYPKHK